MTIYKPNGAEKASEEKSVSYEKLLSPYVIRVPGTTSDVTRAHIEHRRRMFRIFTIFVFLLILIVSILTALYVFKRLAHKPFMAICPVRYHEGKMRGSFDEMIEVEDGRNGYARLQVPSFMDSQASLVIHDFQMNLSVIVDSDRAMCYIMKMEAKFIQPPSSIIDLLNKFRTGYYLPDAEILRENYSVVEPQIEDVQQLGHRIGHECQHFTNYYIRKDTDGIAKRATHLCSMAGENFCLGMVSNRFIHCIKLASCI